jgi:pSer/pThr/pTyr-binding forkhead associated (FHA) protein
MLASIEVQTALLVLKICFLVLLYLFIWRIVRSATRDVRMPQESFILAPSQAAAAGLRRAPAPVTTGRLVAVKSPALEHGEQFELDAKAVTVGRGAPNDIQLDSDEFASSHHARIEPRRDGVWVEDIGSTNGTYVNGTRLERPQQLTPGDVVRIGETDLRYER